MFIHFLHTYYAHTHTHTHTHIFKEIFRNRHRLCATYYYIILPIYLYVNVFIFRSSRSYIRIAKVRFAILFEFVYVRTWVENSYFFLNIYKITFATFLLSILSSSIIYRYKCRTIGVYEGYTVIDKLEEIEMIIKLLCFVFRKEEKVIAIELANTV